MDFGKFWVWHVAACTLFSSWKTWDFKNLRAALVHGPDMLCLDEAVTSYGPKAGPPFLQSPPCHSCSAASSLQTMEQMKTGSDKTAQELHRGHHCQLWELLCSKHAAAQKQCKSQQSQELRTRERTSFCLRINLGVSWTVYCELSWAPRLRRHSWGSGRVKRWSDKLPREWSNQGET